MFRSRFRAVEKQSKIAFDHVFPDQNWQPSEKIRSRSLAGLFKSSDHRFGAGGFEITFGSDRLSVDDR